jgi:hypothetical protein
MQSKPQRGEESRRRAEEQFKATKRANAKTVKAGDAAQQAEAAKTMRLRALRLAKEAADKDVANREAAAKAARSEPRRRVRAPHGSTPPRPK